MRTFCFILLAGFMGRGIVQAQDTVGVMFYNLLQFPAEKPDRISHLKTILTEEKPDVLMVCELSSNTGSVTILTQALAWKGASYQRASFMDNGSLNNMLYYNTKMYSLIGEDTINTSPRFATVYRLLHRKAFEATGDSLVHTFIAVHLKAGNEYAAERGQAAKKIRRYLNQKTSGENVFLAGDFNVYSAAEPAIVTLTGTGKHTFEDPIGELGEWSNNDYYAPIHTQSTRTMAFGGGSTGGLDDRFDFILATADILTGTHGSTYVLGSYKAIGNDGNHFNQAINFKENTAVTKEMANALHEMSDHLPVKLRIANDYTSGMAQHSPAKGMLNWQGQVISGWDFEGLENVEVFDCYGHLLFTQSFGRGQEIFSCALPPTPHVLLLVRVQTANGLHTYRLARQ
ncbi:MAG: endonuclease/exonuclease/phosphatase family protein [Bacteroidetes bacterium]|jgi:exonuclease III|nr:endonuclease/exonuclease/phosphatase family protein [Bacteroidota bacterium]